MLAYRHAANRPSLCWQYVLSRHQPRESAQRSLSQRRLPHKTEVPTIAVELVSEGQANRTRDYDVKRSEYRDAGIREYWIIDRFEKEMTVYRFEKGNESRKVVTARQVCTTPLLPGFKLRLSRLLKLANRWD